MKSPNMRSDCEAFMAVGMDRWIPTPDYPKSRPEQVDTLRRCTILIAGMCAEDPLPGRPPTSNWAALGALVALLCVVMVAATAVEVYVQWRGTWLQSAIGIDDIRGDRSV